MKKSLRLFMIIGAAVMLVFFFLPTATLPIYGGASGWSIMTGVQYGCVTVIPGNFLSIIKAIVPILIGLIWLFGKMNNKGKISGILCIIHAVICVAFMLMVNSMLGNVVKSSPGLLMFVEIALAVLLAIVSFMINSGKLSEDETDLKKVASTVGSAGKSAAASVGAAAQSVKANMNNSGSGNTSGGMNAYSAPAGGQLRKCKNCGATLSEGSDFCGKCGTKYVAQIITHCIKCGTELEESDVFCPVCGTKQEKNKERLCMHCGNTFSENFSFCPHCGKEYVAPEKRVCANCGASLPVGMDFCGKCGTRYE